MCTQIVYNISMNVIFDDDFEWDDDKDKSNQEDHDGLTFEEARLIWDGPVYTFEDERQYDETRWIAIGAIDKNTILYVVFTWRGQRKRIISAREATYHEQTRYFARIKSRRRR